MMWGQRANALALLAVFVATAFAARSDAPVGAHPNAGSANGNPAARLRHTIVRVDASVRNENERTLDADKRAMLVDALGKTIAKRTADAVGSRGKQSLGDVHVTIAHIMEWDEHLVIEFAISVQTAHAGAVLSVIKASDFSDDVTTTLEDSNPEMRFDKLRFATPTVVGAETAHDGGANNPNSRLMLGGAATVALVVLCVVVRAGVQQGTEIQHKRRIGLQRKYRSVDDGGHELPPAAMPRPGGGSSRFSHSIGFGGIDEEDESGSDEREELLPVERAI